jgi:hypothetical protein
MNVDLKSGICSLGRGVRFGWLMFGLVLLVLVGLEAGFRLAGAVWGTAGSSQQTEPVGSLVTEDCWAESQAARTRWEPYVHWRRRKFDGRFVSINEDGIRAT